MTTWCLIAHGGARALAPAQEGPCRSGMQAALEPGIRILSQRGTALDAVEAVVRALEDDPTFNAGTGSVRNEIGGVQMDASIMDGATLDIGAIVGLTDARNPVAAARLLLRDKAVLLAGPGAEAFARQLLWPADAAQDARRQPIRPIGQGAALGGCDTVGCVARDADGNIAVATSTGGLEGSRVGRVGDVPMPGCGFYADNARGAVSLSGEGEAIARLTLASEFLHALGASDVDAAARSTIGRLDRLKAEAGLIAISPDGRLGWHHNSPHFTVGWATAKTPDPEVHLRKSAAP
jgi:beta-aspartyl-peptidase (threonine type)